MNLMIFALVIRVILLTMIVMITLLFREICKNFDEMAGRLGEIPDETKELVELQRFEQSPAD